MTAYFRWAVKTASSSLADSGPRDGPGNANSHRAEAIHPFPAHVQSFRNMDAMSHIENSMRPAVAQADPLFPERTGVTSAMEARQRLAQTGGPQ